jgi:hypothetical protein
MSFRWEDIDHRLAKLRLLDLSIEMNRLIKADESRIRFEQRGNLNRNTVPSIILQMQQDRADDWAQKTYDIYCDVWQKREMRNLLLFCEQCSRVEYTRHYALAPGLSRRNSQGSQCGRHFQQCCNKLICGALISTCAEWRTDGDAGSRLKLKSVSMPTESRSRV